MSWHSIKCQLLGYIDQINIIYKILKGRKSSALQILTEINRNHCLETNVKRVIKIWQFYMILS